MNSTNIRQAVEDDAPEIHQMVMLLAKTTGFQDKMKSEIKDFKKHGFSEKSLFEALIAENNNKPVGLCLYYYTFSSWLGEPGIYIQDIYVNDSFQNQGIGKELVKEAIKLGIRNGATHMRLSVDNKNVQAKNFYEKIGMKHRSDENFFHMGSETFLSLIKEPK